MYLQIEGIVGFWVGDFVPDRETSGESSEIWMDEKLHWDKELQRVLLHHNPFQNTPFIRFYKDEIGTRVDAI
jgi:hypothetical protein